MKNFSQNELRAIALSVSGKSVPDIAMMLDKSPQTIHEWFEYPGIQSFIDKDLSEVLYTDLEPFTDREALLRIDNTLSQVKLLEPLLQCLSAINLVRERCRSLLN